MNVIPMKGTARETHLYGASVGEVHRNRVLERVGTPQAPGELVVLDFRGVQAVTASYLKANLFWLMEAGARTQVDAGVLDDGGPPPLHVYPMVANLTDEVRAELRELLLARGRCCIEARDFSTHVVSRGELHGPLDRVLEDTVKILSALKKPVSALDLDAMRKDDRVKATGWNNRLAQLHGLRLVQRKKENRQWMYRLIAEEVRRG